MTIETQIQKKTRYHHGDLRAQLTEATRQLVEEVGPDQFSVSQACRVAGVSTAAPYRHFKDREEMLAAVMQDGMKRHFALMQRALDGLPPASPERVAALGRVYVNFARDEPGVFRLTFGRCSDGNRNDETDEECVRPYWLLRSEVAAVLGLDDVEHPEVLRRAFLLWTFVHGLAFIVIDEKLAVAGAPIDLDAQIRDIAERVLA